MKAGIHERKWEIDSLCYPIRLAYNTGTYGDATPFDAKWKEAVSLTVKTFKNSSVKPTWGLIIFNAKQIGQLMVCHGGYVILQNKWIDMFYFSPQ